MKTENHFAEIADLVKERNQLEDQIIQLQEILNGHKIGMTESLVDEEDFPRSDVDVFSVRQTRVNIIRALNDHKNISKKLENLLAEYHSQNRPKINEEVGRLPTLSNEPKKLALVGDVTEGSPSYLAGIRKDDFIIEFGKINSSNFHSLHDIGKEVHKSINSYIKVIVEREGHLKRFNLKPKSWSGNGYLGCLLLPATE